MQILVALLILVFIGLFALMSLPMPTDELEEQR